MNKGLCVIGDTHGKYIPYAKIVRKANKEDYATLQLGDMGFSFGHFKHFGIDPEVNRFFAGNHDCYDILLDPERCPPHCLGDFGEVTLGGVTFFFVRGAHSIDRIQRTQGKDWWPEEELSMGQCYQALEAYQAAKPRIMITHDCPNVMRDWFTRHGIGAAAFNPIKSRTGELLQQMYEAYQPEVWIFGHWHKNAKVKIGQTEFICLGELTPHRLGDSG